VVAALTSRLIAFALLLAIVTSPAHGQPGSALPKGTDPVRLALASDGAVWVTEDFAGAARLDPTAGVRRFLERDDEYFTDLAAGSDGSVWLVEEAGVVRIDPAGRVTRVPGDGNSSAVALTTAAGTVWIAYQGVSGRGPGIVRMGADGTSRDFRYDAPDGAYSVNAMAAAPDGSVWFTESGVHHPWVGRMTAEGAFSHVALPPGVGDPGRIAAGADGAIWFTGRHVIGRIAGDGQLAILRLAGDAVPHDIVAGADGAMWFTSDLCLGRVTGTGAVTTWAVAGAVQLEGLAAAADGSVWLADRAGNAVRHFDPSAAAPAPCGAPTLKRAAGATSATVAFERIEAEYFGDIHVHIAREGTERFSEAVPKLQGLEARGDSHSLTVRDLDGDGEPEVTLTVYASGSQCCSWTRFYRYDRARGTYAVRQHVWGYFGGEPVVRDLDGDGRPELRSLDGRFFERFGRQAARPVQIWSYRDGTLRDVTRRFPRLVRQDAAKIWRSYR
jgi:virginiamycin B lyase